MARRSRVSIDDVLQHLDSDDSFECVGPGDSDDDLGMNSDLDYLSDGSEGIIINKPIYAQNNNTKIYYKETTTLTLMLVHHRHQERTVPHFHLVSSCTVNISTTA